MKLKVFYSLIISAVCSNAFGQFELVSETNKNECKWYIKNVSNDSFKLKSISMRFFHQTKDIVFTPSISNPGGGQYQYPGAYYGGGTYSFGYKTIQITALDGFLQPGNKSLISTTTNTGPRKDTIILAGVKVYYADTVNSFESAVFPAGSNSSCKSESIFVSAGTNNAGIKLGSSANMNLHYGVCEPQLIVIVFDNATLERKAVSNIEPHCQNGRLWKDFGHPDNYQVYYTFDITTSLGRLQFDTFVNALSIGDYVAITNQQILPMSNFNFIKTSLRKLGYNPPVFDDVTGYLTMLGKKGAAFEEAIVAYCQDTHGNCSESIEHSMVKGDLTNGIADYSLCYENDVQFLAKLDTSSNNIKQYPNSPISVYPNPSNDGWNISGVNAGDQVLFYALNGQIIKEEVATLNGLYGKDLPAGVYALKVIHYNNQTNNTYILIKE